MGAAEQSGQKKILILANHSGGLYDFRGDLLAAMRRAGRVTAATPRNDKWEELSGVTDRCIEVAIDRRGVNPVRDLSLLRRYRALLREEKPDLVVTYTVKPNIWGGMACRRARVPYAVNITGLGSALENGGLLRRIILFLYKKALAGARVVFFENSRDRDVLCATGVVPAGRDVVLPGAGVNLTVHPALPYPADGPVHFLFVGRVMREKGIDEFLAAARRLKAARGDAVSFEIVGNLEESYRETLAQCEADGIAAYTGVLTDVTPAYRRAHVVVLPSYHEGMSNVLLEGAASARPLITSDIPGCREAVVPGESGLLCPPRDADALYAAMEKLAAMPRDARQEMGRRGCAHITAHFNKTDVVATTLAALGLADAAPTV